MIFAIPSAEQCMQFTTVEPTRGRFVAKNTPDVVESITKQVSDELRQNRCGRSASRLRAILERLTVLQLHELKRSYGLKASGRNKAELVEKLSKRLDSGRRADFSKNPVSADPDRQIVLDLVAGRPGAFDAVYERHVGGVRSVLRKSGMKSCDVDDVVQETFLRLSQLTASIDPDKSLGGFLVTTAKRISIDMFRRQSRKDRYGKTLGNIDEMAVEYDDQDESEQHEQDEQVGIVMTILDEQPERTKNVIRLRFMEGMTFVQIAQELEIGVTTVKDIVSRALKAVRKNSAVSCCE